MQAYIREKLLSVQIETQTLINQYQTKNPEFVVNTIRWCKNLEEELTKLRLPLIGVVSSERGKLIAAMQGSVPQDSLTPKSKRKLMNFQAVESIECINQQISQTIERIDVQFNGWREKIAQLAALSSNQQVIELDIEKLNNATLSNIWQQFGQHKETYNMFQYLAAAMPQADLFYLLRDIIINLLNNKHPS